MHLLFYMFCIYLVLDTTMQKNFKIIWTKSRQKQATDSIQNSWGKPIRQAKGNWEANLPK